MTYIMVEMEINLAMLLVAFLKIKLKRVFQRYVNIIYTLDIASGLRQVY